MMGITKNQCFVTISCLLMIAIANGQESTSFCTQNENAGPSFPKMAERSYRAELAVKDMDRKRMFYVVLVQSLEHNKISMKDDEHFVIFDMASNVSVRNDNDFDCFVENVTDWTDSIWVMAMYYAFSGAAEYINKTAIRGIPTDHWRKCLSYFFHNLTMDIYITPNDESWRMPTVLPFQPVRVEIQGRWLFIDTLETSHHIFDYIRYEQYDGDKHSADLEPPPGSYCSGLKQDLSMPQLPQTMFFSQETTVVTEGGTLVKNKKIYLDEDNHLSRLDHFDGQSEIREIGDPTTGVIYKIDITKRTCNILPISEKSQDHSDINIIYYQDEDESSIQMQTVQDYFMAGEGNIYYGGEHTVRGVSCNLFTRGMDYENSAAQRELYFAKDGIKISNTRGYVQENQLIRVILRTSQGTISSEIYDVDPEPSPLSNPFDVSACFDASDQTRFVISFVSTDPTVQKPEDLHTFAKEARLQIAQLANVSALRVQWEDITFDNGQTQVYGKLLGNPPALDSYEKLASMQQKRKSYYLPVDLQPTVVSADGIDASTCAKYCFKDTSIDYLPDAVDLMPACYSFDYCASSSSCYFFKDLGDLRTGGFEQVVSSADCDHYRRSTTFPPPIPLADAWAKLQGAINKGNLQVSNTNAEQISSNTVFTATSLTNPDPDSSSMINSDSLLFDYKEIRGVKMSNPRAAWDVVSLDYCAKACSNNLKFQCVTFTYCKGSHSCTLHDVKLQETQAQMTSDNCTSYSRSYVKDFEPVFETLLSPDSRAVSLYKETSDVEECAYMCLNHTDFVCESFQYCESGVSLCYLAQVHFLGASEDETGPNENSNCTLYSRNYVTEFQEVSFKVTDYVVDHTMSGISVSQCARICLAEMSYDCSIFQYCETERTCQIINPSAQHQTKLSLTNKADCAVYTKKVKDKVQSANGFSAGAMGGVAAGTLVLGVLLCIIGILVYKAVRGKRDDSMNAQLNMDEVK